MHIIQHMRSAILCEHDRHKSRGLDSTPTIVVKKCVVELEHIITKFDNKRFVASSSPDYWKYSSVENLFKNTCEQSGHSNYQS